MSHHGGRPPKDGLKDMLALALLAGCFLNFCLPRAGPFAINPDARALFGFLVIAIAIAGVIFAMKTL